MARKLKGKIGAKGLKGALLRHQAIEQHGKKLKSKQEHELKKRKPTKAVLQNQKVQREAAGQFIPFEKNSTLLLIGEGDFSFARSIVENELIQPENLVVSSYDNSVSELNLKYPSSFQENYDFLVQEGVKIFFRIDATNLVKSFKLSKKTTWPKLVGNQWQSKNLEYILFNFPHTGKGIKDQDKNIRDHQELIVKFFESTQQFFKQVNRISLKGSAESYTQGYHLSEEKKPKELADDGCGKVIVSLFSGEPYDSWQIKTLAKTTGWKIERSNKFQWENYPGYSHKRTNSEQDTTKPAAERDARTYILEIFNKHKHSKSKKNQKDSDSDEEAE